MNEINNQKYDNSFDQTFKQIDIYKKYPSLIPFVGLKYKQSLKRVLFIGESHYLPPKYNNVSDTSWYEKSLDDFKFDGEAKGWINTRNIINEVINKWGYSKAHSIYRNIGDVFGEVFHKGDKFDVSLPYIAFYNYFQRPAEETGRSIKNDWFTDNKVSFKVLLKLNEILSPDKIIFTSKEAKKAFDSIYKSDDYSDSKDIDLALIDSIQHPNTSWWNRASKVNRGLTGKEKLRKILQSI